MAFWKDVDEEFKYNLVSLMLDYECIVMDLTKQSNYTQSLLM